MSLMLKMGSGCRLLLVCTQVSFGQVAAVLQSSFCHDYQYLLKKQGACHLTLRSS